MRKNVPRSRGCVTHAAILLALPPNQNGYMIRSWAAAFFFLSSSCGFAAAAAAAAAMVVGAATGLEGGVVSVIVGTELMSVGIFLCTASTREVVHP